MQTSYDLIVIGTGSAASAIAYQCRAAGWTVAVIDRRPFGGTCALRGCDPKKVLMGAAEVIDAVARLRGKGVQAPEVRLDWPELMRFKRSFTDPAPERREEGFTAQGIAGYHGAARFTGRHSLRVDGVELEARHVAIAAGAEPAKLPIEGFEHLATSDTFLALDTLPPRIAFVGGGYIASEFAHIAARAGAQVTVLHRGERLLKGFDPDLVRRLTERTRALGVDLRLGYEVTAVRKAAEGYRVHAKGPDGEQVFVTDLAVHGAGRVPAVTGLDLAAGGIDHEGTTIRVNDYLQSVSNPAVYAAGDAARTGLPLTPVATLEGNAVAANLTQGNHVKPDYTGTPSVVFTVPPLARVGLLEEEAHRRGLRFRVAGEDMSDWYSARRVGESCAAFKTLIEEGSGRILGAHLVGPEAAELINLFALAIRRGISAAELRQTLFAYPTAASDIGYML